MIDKDRSFRESEKVLNGESNFSISTKEQLNKCVEHIVTLIKDSFVLYNNNSFSSSVFLSIAIIEEVAKVHMGMFVKPAKEYKRNDKLRDHKTKEIIGANYTISMGDRLIEAIGEDNLESIYNLVYSGKLKKIREQSIYCDRENEEIVVPKQIINQEFSRNMLLFAIELFDDNLVGYTHYSINISYETDIIFKAVSKM